MLLHKIGFALGASVFVLSLAVARPLESSPFARLVAAEESPASAPVQAGLPPADRSVGNRVEMLSNGYDALLLRVHLIRSATRSIDLQTFIWTNDEVGRLMVWELLEAARRGVKVRIIADQMFSDQEPDVVAFLATAHPNFEVRHYRPPSARLNPAAWHTILASLRSFHDVNQRMHSKVMIVDDAVLITGGRNVENTYFDHSTGLNFRDRDVLAVGPVVRSAAEEFAQFWNYPHTVPSRALVDVTAALKKGTFRRYDHRADYDFGGYFVALDREANDAALIDTRFCAGLRPVDRAVFLYDSPGKLHGESAAGMDITRDLAATLQQARRSVVIQTPYLVLSHAARKLLLELRHRTPAIDVRISTNSFASTDNLYAYSANYRLRNDYVQVLGLEIFELKPLPGELLTVFPTHPQMANAARERRRGASGPHPYLSLHAKSLVIDDAAAFVGSFNLDPRSETLNTEVGLLVTDAAFAKTLRAEIEGDMLPENSWVIARRRMLLRMEVVNGLVGDVLSLSPIDVWPIQNTSSFELLPGREPVRASDPTFHQRYRDIGPFPGTDGLLSQKEILTRIYKAVGSPLTPIL